MSGSSKFDFDPQTLEFRESRSRENAIQILAHILSKIGSEKEMEGRMGAYFSKSDLDGVPFYTTLVGLVSRAKRFKYKFFSEEKLKRVCLLAKYADHNLSRQSADDEIELYIGAVVGKRFGHGISGFPGEVDEMGSVAWAVLDGDLDVETARKLTSKNSYFGKLEFLFHITPAPYIP